MPDPGLTVGEAVVLLAILTTHHPPPACRDRAFDKLARYLDLLPPPEAPPDNGGASAFPSDKEGQ